MRLDKFVAATSDYSRSEVKRLIKQKVITVNGAIVTQPMLNINEYSDVVSLYDEVLQYQQSRYFMLHKPMGTVCANQDSEHPTVIDLIDEVNTHQLQIVGRLDKDTTGLVLLTDDGQWNHKITSPRSKCKKVYRVTIEQPLSAEAQEQLNQGVQLNNEKQPTKPAQVSIIDEQTIELTIEEGKYHQVKRMMAAVGNHVIALHRLQVGTILLDPALAEGEYRPLFTHEINSP